MDIGGHASRWIHLDSRSTSDREPDILDFYLNERCAAGTGSFLEEQAVHLGIRVEDEFSAEAFRSQSPKDLGSQCTVFMDTELVNALRRRLPVETCLPIKIAFGHVQWLLQQNADFIFIPSLVDPYPENNRILFLYIAKMVDFARKGTDGVVNVICFNCMLGTVSEAISTQIKRDHGSIPIPTLVYSGSDISSENTKLKAFVYQVHQFAERKKDKKYIGGLDEVSRN